jgi:hypothetical protein
MTARRKTPESLPEPELSKKPSSKFTWSLSWPSRRRDRVLVVGGVLLAVVLLLIAIPYSRYGLIGQLVKRPVSVKVTDSRTHKPVSDAAVTIGSQRVRADANGQAKFAAVPVGGWDVSVSKKYYNLGSTHLMVPVFGPVKQTGVSLAALGNAITVKVINKITQKPLAGASVEALGATAKTDAKGEAGLVLPVGKPAVDGIVKLTGYNQLAVSLKNEDNANSLALAPSGKIYFLSKRTGVINVMKSDLDGANATVVLAGTGKETDDSTILLSTRDWKYLVLESAREGKQKLYLLNTSTDKLSLIDQGDAEFTLLGWYDHHVAFRVERHNVDSWQSGAWAYKSYNADRDQLTTLISASGSGSSYYDALFDSVYNAAFMDDRLVYTHIWQRGGGGAAGQQNTIESIKLDGSGKTVIKGVDATTGSFESLVLAKPTLAHFTYYLYGAGATRTYFQYDGSKVTQLDSSYTQNAPNYLASPDEDYAFWFEPRDGKNTMFIGDEQAANGKEIATLSEYKPYGWYSDDYVLLSKNGSELYIAPREFTASPLKIADYHKPAFIANGYGGGYGGQ